jgi:stress-induced morphogen
MMDAGEVNIKERISMTRMVYSILKEEMKDDECGWS